MRLTVNEIVDFTNGELLTNNGEIVIESCVIDSRKASPNSMFVPFVGENVDGYSYIKSAIEKGCKCVLIENERYLDEDLNCQFILVENNQSALQKLAERYREKLSTFVIGVTGSNGKTTTKDLVASIAKGKGETLKTLGNLNNELGLPLMILQCEPHHEIAVLEMGMSQLGEIDLLSKIGKPNVGIITNIGESHLEHLKTKDNILKAKSEIFNHMSQNGVAIINGDDEYLKKIYSQLPRRITYGLSKENDLCAYNITSYNHKTTFQVKGLGYDFSASIPLLGDHNVINSLAAIAVGHVLELDEKLIIQGLTSPEMTSMRTEIINLRDDLVVINDCYNASETSTLAALKVLKEYKGASGRKIAILGDMLELGDYSEEAHFNVGAFAASNNVSTIIAIGQFSGDILKGAQGQGFEGEMAKYKDSHEAARNIMHHIRQADTVLVKGSRGVKMEEIVAMIKEEF